MFTRWRRWHAGRALPRRICKLAIFIVFVLLVLYPRPDRLVISIARLCDLNSTLDPRAAELDPLEFRVRAVLTPGATAQDTLAAVQHVVYEALPYAWDWDTWGVMEYLPSVREALRTGREDCDGRAVVAASLLRRLGHDAILVSDFLHVWVQTPEGETMSPRAGPKTLRGGESGTQIGAGALQNLARGTAFGVAVFPATRVALILAALILLTLRPGLPAWRGGCGAALLIAALLLLRATGEGVAHDTARVAWIGVGAGTMSACVGWLILALPVGRSRRDSPLRNAPVESARVLSANPAAEVDRAPGGPGAERQ